MNDAQPAKPSGEPADPAGPTEHEADDPTRSMTTFVLAAVIAALVMGVIVIAP